MLLLTKVLSREVLRYFCCYDIPKKDWLVRLFALLYKNKEILKSLNRNNISGESSESEEHYQQVGTAYAFSVHSLKQESSQLYSSLKFSYYQLQAKVFEEQILHTYDLCISPTLLLLFHSCLKHLKNFKFWCMTYHTI